MLFLDLNKMSKLTELTMSSFLIVVSNISNNADLCNTVYFDVTSDNYGVLCNKQHFPNSEIRNRKVTGPTLA